MTVTEAARHHLFTRIEEVLGPDAASTMMDLLPPVGWADVATKHDLRQLERNLDVRFEAIDQRFTGIDQRLDRLDQRLDTLDGKVDATGRSFITWLFASQAGVIAAVGGMLLAT